MPLEVGFYEKVFHWNEIFVAFESQKFLSLKDRL